jgi:hypothetical protein
MNLSLAEEKTIVQHILELDSRGYPPSLNAVRDMANDLLAARGAPKVGVKWLNRFMERTLEIIIKVT